MKWVHIQYHCTLVDLSKHIPIQWNCCFRKDSLLNAKHMTKKHKTYSTAFILPAQGNHNDSDIQQSQTVLFALK